MTFEETVGAGLATYALALVLFGANAHLGWRVLHLAGWMAGFLIVSLIVQSYKER